ncbi:hypothetical protein SALBM311S_00626 [Streptomyces alboniger]
MPPAREAGGIREAPVYVRPGAAELFRVDR